MTATAQKRKMRLKERSLKRKSKKGARADEDKVRLFYIVKIVCLRCGNLLSFYYAIMAFWTILTSS